MRGCRHPPESRGAGRRAGSALGSEWSARAVAPVPASQTCHLVHRSGVRQPVNLWSVAGHGGMIASWMAVRPGAADPRKSRRGWSASSPASRAWPPARHQVRPRHQRPPPTSSAPRAAPSRRFRRRAPWRLPRPIESGHGSSSPAGLATTALTPPSAESSKRPSPRRSDTWARCTAPPLPRCAQSPPLRHLPASSHPARRCPPRPAPLATRPQRRTSARRPVPSSFGQVEPTS